MVPTLILAFSDRRGSTNGATTIERAASRRQKEAAHHQIGSVIAIMKLCDDMPDFRRTFDRVFSKQQQLVIDGLGFDWKPRVDKAISEIDAAARDAGPHSREARQRRPGLATSTAQCKCGQQGIVRVRVGHTTWAAGSLRHPGDCKARLA